MKIEVSGQGVSKLLVIAPSEKAPVKRDDHREAGHVLAVDRVIAGQLGERQVVGLERI